MFEFSATSTTVPNSSNSFANNNDNDNTQKKKARKRRTKRTVMMLIILMISNTPVLVLGHFGGRLDILYFYFTYRGSFHYFNLDYLHICPKTRVQTIHELYEEN